MSKRSHRQALPIIVFGVGVFLVSLAGISAILPDKVTPNSLNGLISERLLTIRFTIHGLVEFGRYQVPNTTQTDRPTVGDIEAAGQSAAAHGMDQVSR